MNRREFAKCIGAVAGVAAIHGFSFANEGEKKMKCAVVYFSWSGNTRFAAETIAKKTGADLYEIKAETPYNSNYGKCCDEAKPECYGKTLRPIKPIEGLDLAKYDLVFVGSGQEGLPLPDARRRRNAARRQGVRGDRRRCGDGSVPQGLRRLVDQVQRQGARGFRRREDCRQVTSHAKKEQT